MFKKVISYPGFWRSVLVLGIIYMLILFLIQWAFTGFASEFFSAQDPLKLATVFLIGVFVCGFSVSYAKFWAKFKRDEYRK